MILEAEPPIPNEPPGTSSRVDVGKEDPVKVEALKDGATVLLQEPQAADAERLRRFFVGLPVEDRRYFRFDLGRADVVETLIRQAEAGMAYRVLALVDNEVVGHGALYFSHDGWQRHIGEIRVLVAPDYRGLRLGTHIIGQLFEEAEKRGVTRVVARMAEPETAGRKIFERLGFIVDATLPDHVKDADGNLHALVVMSCALDEVSRAMRDFYRDDNWPDG